jgi:hypothetical protein
MTRWRVTGRPQGWRGEAATGPGPGWRPFSDPRS